MTTPISREDRRALIVAVASRSPFDAVIPVVKKLEAFLVEAEPAEAQDAFGVPSRPVPVAATPAAPASTSKK